MSLSNKNLSNKKKYIFIFALGLCALLATVTFFVFQIFIATSSQGEGALIDRKSSHKIGTVKIAASSPEDKMLIDIPPGATFYEVAEELENKKLIKSSFYFKLLIRFFHSGVLHVGEYEMSGSETIFQQFQKINLNKAHYTFVSFAEGLNHYEMAEILKQNNFSQHKEFLNLVWDKKFIKQLLGEDLDSLEGYLFPETYPLNKYTHAKTLIKSMVQNFLKFYNETKQDTRLSRHEVVTLASLIEKETSLLKEAPLVSSVFYNRLEKNMKLQTDPTILYTMYLKRGFSIEKNIRKKDILMPSEYNTYVIKGLPKGPVANPGLQSLKASFRPAKTNYFYFVSRNDGSHDFSKTYKEHAKKVYRYQIQPFK